MLFRADSLFIHAFHVCLHHTKSTQFSLTTCQASQISSFQVVAFSSVPLIISVLTGLLFCEPTWASVALLSGLFNVSGMCLLLLVQWHSVQVMRMRRKGKELDFSPGNVFQERNDQSCVQCWRAIQPLCHPDIYL